MYSIFKKTYTQRIRDAAKNVPRQCYITNYLD